MLWEILEARDSARVNRIHMGGRGTEHGTVTDLGDDEADWAPPGAGDRPMMLGKDTASRGGSIGRNLDAFRRWCRATMSCQTSQVEQLKGIQEYSSQYANVGKGEED